MSITTHEQANGPIAIIGGSGFGRVFLEGRVELVETEFGSATVTRGSLNNRDVIFLARHGEGHAIPPHRINHHANVKAMAQLGVTRVYATAAVGSLRMDMAPGEFVILDDFVDFSKGGTTTFFDKIGDVRHTDFSAPYDRELRRALIDSCEFCRTEGGETIHKAGTYLCLSGPRYETPAEVRLFAQWGCDVVGMTGAPEAILCREAGLSYASIAAITNYACGLVDTAALSHADVEARMERSHAFLMSVFMRIIGTDGLAHIE